MKKVSLILAALALVLGISQCKKQEDPMGKLVTQKVTFTTSFGDGSKLNPGEAGGSLNPKWVVGDKIIVSDGVTTPASELECKKIENGGTDGVFEGTITCQEGAELTFSYNTIDWMNQDGSLQIYLEGKSWYQESGNYEVNMTMPCAILKLDLAELATAEGVDVYVKIGDATEPVAKISSVKTADSQVYLLLLLQASGETTLTFTNGTKTITKTYNLAPNSFNSAGGNGGYAPVEPDAPTTPKFTVAAGKTVEFAPGNLWADATDAEHPVFHFEANQWDFRTYEGKKSCIGGSVTTDGTPSGHWGLFGWSTSSTTYGMSTSKEDDDYSGDFVDWGTASGLPSAGEGKSWRTLTADEWSYLLGTASPSRADASSLRAWKDLGSGIKGLVILPDGTENPSTVFDKITSTGNLAQYNAVFLPAAGSRYGTYVGYVGSNGYYWSSTPYGDNEDYAYYMYFNSGGVYTSKDYRVNGNAVRLVR